MPTEETPQEMAQMRAAIAAELRAAAALAGLDQGEVADRAGIHRVTVNRLFKGHRPVDTEQLTRLAVAMGTTPGVILDTAFLKQRQQFARHNVENEGGGEDDLGPGGPVTDTE